MVKTKRLIRRSEVLHLTGFSRDGLARELRAGRGFPQPIRISERVPCWDEAEVMAWIAARLSGRAAGH
jgi:predicted DNA-binding transcriptional regulator AlpA